MPDAGDRGPGSRRYHRLMVRPASRTQIRRLQLLRLIALVPIAAFAGHELLFLLQYGTGDDYTTIMLQSGHGYWLAFSVVILVLCGGVIARGAFQVHRLSRRVIPASRHLGGARAPSYRAELRAIWPALFLLSCAFFTVQENLEHIGAGLAPHGIGSLLGAEHPLAVPALALTSLLVAAIGALIRWRVQTLERRLGQPSGMTRERGLRATRPARRWRSISAMVATARALVRQDAGRAPPRGTQVPDPASA